MPPRFVVDERERPDTPYAGRGLAGLEVGKGDDARLLDCLLQRRERGVAEADARGVPDDRLVDADAERTDLPQPAASLLGQRSLAPDASGQVQQGDLGRGEVDVDGELVLSGR